MAPALAALALVTGCVSRLPYAAPADVPTAHLTLVGRGLYVTVLDERDCTRPQALVADLTTDFLSIGSDERAVEVDIEADRWMGFSASYPNCNVGLRFTPRAGERYEAHFDLIGPYCRFRVTHLVATADGVVQRIPERSAEKAEHLCGR